jgi:ATP-dependent DNA helicase HFM1/MER3
LIPENEQHSRYEPRGSEELQAEEHDLRAPQLDLAEQFQPSYHASTQIVNPNPSASATPVVQGISLVSTHALPDRFRAVFPHPLFNAIQSKSFDTIYNSNDNFVLSAPTGSGKTAVLELAICRLVSGFAAGSFKIVYQAPTKSLCSERQRDWEAKFASLDLKCAELTGDTDATQLRNVQHASIIITTPEKWDSVTRKWKDHQKLMQMVKLFLIDEVHILKEDRGATLEAVVSRMKSVGSNVRFVALSATVPNSDDIAAWLGKDPMNAHVAASRERFGEGFRPVRLAKHVRGYQGNLNDFAFEKTLDTKLPEVIAKWSQRKPIMVFCFTRKSCLETAKLLTNWWATKEPRERYWSASRKKIVVADKDLRGKAPSSSQILTFNTNFLQIPCRQG